MLRATLFALVLAAPWSLANAAETAPQQHPYAQVDIAPTKTSIYIGTVSMTMPTFVRHGDVYEAPYYAKVFPYFFSSERGTLRVTVTPEQLDQLRRGETITFTGRGIRADGAERQVEGKATPADAVSGKLKVRVRVSRKLELIFNTTYRFRE